MHHYATWNEATPSGNQWCAQVLEGDDERLLRFRRFNSQAEAMAQLNEWRRKFGE